MTDVNVRMFSYSTVPHFEAVFYHQQTFIQACRNGRIDEARQLLGSGANVNFQDSVRINMEPLKFVFLIVLQLDDVAGWRLGWRK